MTRGGGIALCGLLAVAFAVSSAALAPAGACAQAFPVVPELPLPTLGPIDPTCSKVPDTDRDTVWDYEDNCHRLFNPSQLDTDKDAGEPPFEPVPLTFRDPQTGGDACDIDDDGDTIPDIRDTCPKIADPDQKDSDGDGLGDLCDPTPGTAGGGPAGAPKLTIRGLARSYRAAELRAGLAVGARCSSACALSGVLRARKTVLGRGGGGLTGAGSTFVFVRLSAEGRKRIARARRIVATVVVQASDDVGHKVRRTRRVTLRR